MTHIKPAYNTFTYLNTFSVMRHFNKMFSSTPTRKTQDVIRDVKQDNQYNIFVN